MHSTPSPIDPLGHLQKNLDPHPPTGEKNLVAKNRNPSPNKGSDTCDFGKVKQCGIKAGPIQG